MADNGVIGIVERSTSPNSPSSGVAHIYVDTSGSPVIKLQLSDGTIYSIDMTEDA
jgi:hypothetical protein